jgi:hypothetical protein
MKRKVSPALKDFYNYQCSQMRMTFHPCRQSSRARRGSDFRLYDAPSPVLEDLFCWPKPETKDYEYRHVWV